MQALIKIVKQEPTLPFVVFMAAAYALYWTTFGHSWNYDDFPVIVQNSDIRSLQAFWQDQYPGRPIRELSYLIDFHFFGLAPAGYHLQHIFWHGLNASLLFGLIRRFGGGRPVAWLAALLFLVHPLLVEVVANLGHRKDSLALAFALMALLAYMKAFDRVNGRLLWLGLALAFYYLAYQSKQHMIGLPLVFFAYEFTCLDPQNRFLARCKWLNFSGMAISLCAFLWWALFFMGSPRFNGWQKGLNVKLVTTSITTLSDYYLTVLKAISFQFVRIIFPSELYPEYVFSVPTSWGDPWVVGALLLLLLLIGMLFFTFRRDSLVFCSLVFVVVTWMPISNLFGYLAYPAADRYLYAPLAGVLTVLSVMAFKLVRGKVSLFVGAGLIVVGIFSQLTLWQIPVWATPDTLAAQILKFNPRSTVALARTAEVYSSAGDNDKALEIYLTCLELEPFNEHFIHNVGAIYLEKNQIDTAIFFFEKAIEANGSLPTAYLNYGLAMDRKGDTDKAIELIKKGIDLNKTLVSGYQTLGAIYFRIGQVEKARDIYAEGIRYNPLYPIFYHDIGLTYFYSDDFENAEKYFLQALELYPNNPAALKKLSELYAKAKRNEDVEKVNLKLKELEN